MVVEDETIVAMDLRRSLEGFGYSVSGMAISGSEALEIATESRPDIVLMDVQLDGQMDGIEAARRLRDLFDVPVVFLTAYSNESTLQRAKTARPFGFLLKPFQDRELRSAIEVALYAHGMETKLRRREAWLNAILQGMADAVIAFDAAGFVTFMNPPAEALTGRSLERARGLTMAKMLRLMDGDRKVLPIDPTSGEGRPRGPAAAILFDAEGNETPVELTLTRLEDDKRRSEGTVVVLRDVSLRLKAEQAEALRRSEERLRALIDNGSDMVGVVDAELKLRFVSPSVCRILGYAEKELLGATILDLVNPEDREVMAEAMEAVRQRRHGVAPREYRIRRRDGSTVMVEAVTTHLLDHPLVRGIVINARDVTERWRMEAELRQSERIYRGLFEKANDCIVIFEPEDERVLEVNDRACETYGFDRSEFVGMSLKDLSENVDRGRGHVAATLAADSVYRFETAQYRRDGAPLNLEITASVVDLRGTRAIYSIGRDVTDRKRAERELLRANRRLEILNIIWREVASARSPRDVVRAALSRMVELGPFDFASVQVAEAPGQNLRVFATVGDLGLGPGEGAFLPFGSNPARCVADPAEVSHCPNLGANGSGCELARSHSGGGAGSCACAALLVEGAPPGRLHLVSRRPESLESGDLEVAREVAGVIGVVLHQGRLRAELADHQQRLQALVDNLPDGVVCLDQEHRVTLANPSGARLLRAIAGADVGDVVEKLVGRPAAEVTSVPPGDRSRIVNLETEDHRAFELAVVPLTEDRGGIVGYIIVIRELTRELEERKRLQLSERLVAVGQLAAGIAHDFNNMLQAISGLAHLIQNDDQAAPAVVEKARGISQQGKRGAKLVRQILDFSRVSVIERRPLRLEIVIKETMKMLEQVISEKVTVSTTIAPGEYVVVADPVQIQQVLINLAVNARDAMPEGGELTIDLDRVVFAVDKPRPFPQMAAGEWFRLKFSDSGTGMPPGVASRVFEPFFTTKGPGEGTGLGLAQVYGIVKQHEGFIDLETALGAGSTFVIYLPISRLAAHDEDSGEPVPDGVGSGELVLLVEDELPVRDVIHEMLESLGFEVVTAGSGAEALQVFERFRSDIDLVVCDVVLPGTGGIAFSKRVKELSADLPVILMSGYPVGDDARSELAAGTLNWITKPFSTEQLARIIARALPARDLQ
jgi:PAS domain S-box-containing protein